jgi:hypothetical protein
MRNAHPDLDGNDLARMPRLRVVHVVGKLETCAQPEVAFRGIVLGILGSEFGTAFNVRRVVETDVLLDFGTAVGDKGGSNGARGRRGDDSVAEDGGDKDHEGCDGELHCESGFGGIGEDSDIIREVRDLVLYPFPSSVCMHSGDLMRWQQYLEANLEVRRVFNLYGGKMGPVNVMFIAMDQACEAGANGTTLVILRPR